MDAPLQLETSSSSITKRRNKNPSLFQRVISSTRNKIIVGSLALGPLAGTANSPTTEKESVPAQATSPSDIGENEKAAADKEPDWKDLREKLSAIRESQKDMINKRYEINKVRANAILNALAQNKHEDQHKTFRDKLRVFASRLSNWSAQYNLESYRRIQKEEEDYLQKWEETLEISSDIEDHVLFEERYQELITRQEKLVLTTVDTPEKLHAFFKEFMSYTRDDSDQNGYIDDYWQTWTETLQRMKNGKIHGDCDDYAFLARYILRHHGFEAHVMRIPYHAFCIWVKVDETGRFHASSIGTEGLDQNGDRYGDDKEDLEAKKGYETLEEAINSIRRKFAHLFKNSAYKINPEEIYLIEIPSFGEQDDWIPIHPRYLLKDVEPNEKLERGEDPESKNEVEHSG